MSKFKIITQSGKQVEIDHPIIPCCYSGHGECCSYIFDNKILGICCGDCGINAGVKDVFWCNELTESEVDIEERPPLTQEEINAKYKAIL